MKTKNRKIKRIFQELKIALVYFFLMFLAIWVLCFFLSLPEILVSLILGF